MVSLAGVTVGFFVSPRFFLIKCLDQPRQSGEMVDTHALGACTRKGVEVQVLSLAQHTV